MKFLMTTREPEFTASIEKLSRESNLYQFLAQHMSKANWKSGEPNQQQITELAEDFGRNMESWARNEMLDQYHILSAKPVTQANLEKQIHEAAAKPDAIPVLPALADRMLCQKWDKRPVTRPFLEEFTRKAVDSLSDHITWDITKTFHNMSQPLSQNKLRKHYAGERIHAIYPLVVDRLEAWQGEPVLPLTLPPFVDFCRDTLPQLILQELVSRWYGLLKPMKKGPRLPTL